ncbi:MAG: hypothetical protein EOP06_07490, partial [Proteobacteria bacterium]
LQRLLIHIEKNLEWASLRPESAQVLVHIYVSASHDPVFSKLYDAMIARAHDRIREHLLAGVRERIFTLDLSTELMARTLHDLIVGSFIKMMASRIGQPIVYKPTEWKEILEPLLGVDKKFKI